MLPNKFLFIFIISALFTTCSFAQSADSSSVRGTIIDSTTNKPVSYAKIELHGTIVLNTYTDDKGQFAFTGVLNKQYELVIKTIGYVEKSLLVLPGHLHVGIIFIHPLVKQLNAVVIQGEKPIIENKIDRLVFNPDVSTIQNSVTVLDVLQKTPLLSTGQNGQLLLRGKPNVRIYLDDKPVPAEVIKGLPASNISSIEIITNPSAKYDAEGVAIVNIITKKKKLDGYEGTILAGGGVYDRANGLFTVAVKKSKLSINFTYSFNDLTNKGTTENTITRPTSFQEQDGTVRNRQAFQFANIGLDYQIDTLNKVGGSVNVYQYIFRKTFRSSNTDTNPLDSNGNFKLSSFDSVKRFGGYGEMSYSHLFPHAHSSINASILYTQLTINDDLNQSQTIINNNTEANYNNINNQTFKETTYQINFDKQFKNKSKLELGSKFIVRDNSSAYTTNFDTTKNTALSSFIYKQSVFALYGLYTFNVNKLNIQLGLRNEYTFLNSFAGADETSQPKQHYGNLFPSANVLYKLPDDQDLKLSYSSKIQRPGIFYLNPYVNPLDPRNVTTGSPSLQPEIIDHSTIDYSKTIGKNYFDGSITYMHDNNAISSYTSSLSPFTLLTTYKNINEAHSYSADILFSTTALTHNNFSFTVGEEDYFINDVDTKNSGWNFYTTVHDSYSFKNNWSASINFSYVSQQITIQGKSPGSLSNSFGLTKSLLKRKLLVSFSTDDPFRVGGIFKSYANGPGFTENTDSKIILQTFQFRVAYSFGKRSSTKSHESKVKNSDLKTGGL